VSPGIGRTTRYRQSRRRAADQLDRNSLAADTFRGRRGADPARTGAAPRAASAERGYQPPVGSGSARDLSGSDDCCGPRALCGRRARRQRNSGGRPRRRKRYGRGRIMKNIGQLMKQAQEMQAKMAEMQAELEAVQMTGVAGAGMIQLTLNGKG